MGQICVFGTDLSFWDRIENWDRLGFRGMFAFRLETFETGLGFRTALGFGSVFGSGSGLFLDQILILRQNRIPDRCWFRV